MKHHPLAHAACAFTALVTAAVASEWHVTPSGTASGAGTKESPWDLAAALDMQKAVQPGDTVWIHGGTYRHPDRKPGATGFKVRLAGKEGAPVQIRGVPGERVTIDGGIAVQEPSTELWVRDLEIIVSENATLSRRVEERGSHPQSIARPWGGLNVHSGRNCKFINLVLHDNAQGVSWWVGSTDSELHGCIIFDNGWDAPDRGHGHAIYSQNRDGTKVISDCIMTGGYGQTMHAYGSEKAWVDNFLITGCIAYDAGRFLIGGGRPSRGIRVLENFLHKVDLQLGYSAPHNEDCELRGNVVIEGQLRINKFRNVVNEGNTVLSAKDPRPAKNRVIVRPNKYDPNRAHVIVLNFEKQADAAFDAGPFLAAGEAFRLHDPRQLFGPPVLSTSYQPGATKLPVAGEFAAFVLIKGR